jgi:hypothetical protein
MEALTLEFKLITLKYLYINLIFFNGKCHKN